jgi:iron(III) transport system substrate-binding protein
MALVVGLALAAVGCGGDDGPVLNVYSGRHYDVELAFERFEEETGIDVEFLTGNDAELRERIEAEGEDTEADVYLTVDAGNLAAAAADDLFQPLDSAMLREAIPAEYRDPDDLWFALALRYRTIVYNTDTMAEADVPTTYAALADPQWQGRVCMRNASNDYQQSLVASMIAADGEEQTLEVLRGWAANAEIFANDVELLEAMAAGACDVGVANHYYLARAIEEDPDFPVDLVWAEQDGRGVHTNISGGGVTKEADHPDVARQFLEWLATDGQDVLVATNHEYPANPAIAPEPLIAERFGVDFARDPLQSSEMGLLNPAAVVLMDEANFG